MKLYSVISKEVSNDNSQILKNYGIKYCFGRESFTIEDITPDYDRLKRLVNLCNKLDLEPSQISEVVEDFLSE